MSTRLFNSRTGSLLVLMLALSGCSDGSSPDPATAEVRSVSGKFDLEGTSWVRCHADEPEAGKSRRTVDSYRAGKITHVEDVFDGSTSCTGTPDDSAHVSVSGELVIGPDRTVTWNGAPPTGLATSVVASGVSLSAAGQSFKTLIFVDDTAAPRRLYGGNEDTAPYDAEGFPTELEGLAATEQ